MTEKPPNNRVGDAVRNAKIIAGGDPDEGVISREDLRRVWDKEEVVEEINDEYALVLLGSRAAVLRELPQARNPEERLRYLSTDAFKTWAENRSGLVMGGDNKAKWCKFAPLWLGARTRRQYDGIEFFPNPDGAPSTPGYLNLWRGFAFTPDPAPARERAGKYAIFRDHLLTNICSGVEAHFEWFWAWCASLVQRPRDRDGTAIVLRGKMGTGKTVAGKVIGNLFPSHYFMVDDGRYVTGQFNAHMASCLLLQVDEGVWAGDKSAEGRLKGLVTSDVQMIEAKGVDPIRLENRVRLIFSSNESWVVPAGMDERRFAVFDVAAHAKENQAYFGAMYAELENGGYEALLADLLAYDLKAPGAANPRVIPKTRALLDQKFRSLDPVASWWYGRLVAGAPTHRANAWPTKIPAGTCFNDYLRTSDKIGVRRKADETAFGISFRVLVPGLETKKLRAEVEDYDDQGRVIASHKLTRCYVLPPLQACRDHFEALMQQPIDWQGEGAIEEEGEAVESEADPPDYM